MFNLSDTLVPDSPSLFSFCSILSGLWAVLDVGKCSAQCLAYRKLSVNAIINAILKSTIILISFLEFRTSLGDSRG